MNIAIMMRAMDKDAGFRALTDGLVRAMLALEPGMRFTLIFQTDKWIDHFAEFPNARPVLASVSNKFLWDQLAVPYVAWREGASVIFNPKFFVPFLSPCPVTMGMQEPSWFTRPDEYGKFDRWYQQVMIPLSIRRCAHLFPNSRFILEENRKVLGMPIENATIQYSAASEQFHPVHDPGLLEPFRSRHRLPDRFILCVTRVIHPGMRTREFFPGKSPEIAYRAFMKIKDHIPQDLVFAGNRVREYLLHTEGADADFSRVKFLEFVPFEDMHLLYNLADVFVNPCMYEGCPNTVLQAMACGRPMVVANSGGSGDVAEGAALMATPMDVDDFADKMAALCQDDAFRQEVADRSLERTQAFSWRKTARVTIDALVKVVTR